MSKKNFMKAMGCINDETLERCARFEKTLERKSVKSRFLRIAAVAACFAILIAAIPVSLSFRDDAVEPIIEKDYFVMDGAAVKYLTAPEFKSNRVAGEVSEEFRQTAANFAFELLKESNKADYDGDSLLISPLSVMLALSMSANGAEGNTLKEFKKVLCGKMDVESLNAQLFNYTSSLVSTDKAKFNLANAVWMTSSPTFSVNRNFISRIENTFDADIVAADLTKPAVIGDINSWVKEETFGMIEKILSEGDLDEYSIMVLLNAVAFDAQWEEEISDDSCYPGVFNGTASTDTVTLMKTEGRLYISGENEKGFVKNYADGHYAYLALLPNKEIEIADYVDSLSGEYFLELYDGASRDHVEAFMPKYSFDCSLDMDGILREMGIVDAFVGEQADFSGLGESSEGNIYIDQIIHKTRIDLDNKGTRAAAATAVGQTVLMSAPKQVFLNRPFVYAIIDTQTGLPIFLGVCENISGQ